MGDSERSFESSVVYGVRIRGIVNSRKCMIRWFWLLYDWLNRFDWSAYVAKLRGGIRGIFSVMKQMFCLSQVLYDGNQFFRFFWSARAMMNSVYQNFRCMGATRDGFLWYLSDSSGFDFVVSFLTDDVCDRFF